MDGYRWMRVCLMISSILGVFFLWVASPVTPPRLFTILLLGEVAFVGTTLAAFMGWAHAYKLGLALAVMAIAASWISPAHISFLLLGRTIESSILLMGNAVQIAYVAAYIQSNRTPR